MTRVNLARYRVEKARQTLTEAKDSLDQNHFGMSVNRSYYAMFISARALLALKELDSSKHSGVISLFNQHIVKPGGFSKEFSKFLPKAKDIRENAEGQIDNAERFVAEAEKALFRMIKEG